MTDQILSPVKRARSCLVKHRVSARAGCLIGHDRSSPITLLEYVQTPNGAHIYQLRPFRCSSYRRNDSGSLATDDLSRNKSGITDPPVG